MNVPWCLLSGLTASVCRAELALLSRQSSNRFFSLRRRKAVTPIKHKQTASEQGEASRMYHMTGNKPFPVLRVSSASQGTVGLGVCALSWRGSLFLASQT